MKIVLSILILLITVTTIHAQTWDEWFRQKKTQKKYLLQQIAALQTYIVTAEKGYRIASDGIHAINNIKNGEFNLHSLFFSSLKTVNPRIKNAAFVAEIIAYQIAIVNKFKNINKQNLSSDEVAYIGTVYCSVITESLKDIDALITIVTDNGLQMTDDERIQRITALHSDMQDKFVFSQSFTNNANILSVQKQQQLNDAVTAKQLYNLK
ncbi:hypothetical protein GALL_165690 [mine drainage metagenome]|uniref:TerB family tellurite resistance protein n=1 Tax=mine drainage metagenome TaxID=410659 RepID=A0A1J5RYS1_9ZZZZ